MKWTRSSRRSARIASRLRSQEPASRCLQPVSPGPILPLEEREARTQRRLLYREDFPPPNARCSWWTNYRDGVRRILSLQSRTVAATVLHGVAGGSPAGSFCAPACGKEREPMESCTLVAERL